MRSVGLRVGNPDSLDRPAEEHGGRLIEFPVRAKHALPQEPTLPGLLRREARHRRLLGAADALMAVAALIVVLSVSDTHFVQPAALIAMPLVVLVFKIAGLYDRDQMRLVHSTLDEAPALFQLTGLYALGLTILAPMLLGGSPTAGEVASLWLLTFGATFAGRIVAREIAARSLGSERCLVVGDPSLVSRIQDKIITSNARASVVASRALDGEGGDAIRSLGELRRIAHELDVHRLIIAPTTAGAEEVIELIRVAKAAGLRVSVLPRMLEVVGSSVEFDDLDGLTMLGIRPFGLSRSSRLLKRAFDLIVTSVGLVAVSPLLIAIAIAIRLDSRGPVLFRQVRVGRDGREFHIFKFRSMVVDAEQQKDRLRALNEVGEGNGGMFKMSADPRVTRVGRVLRKTSLDELPQLFNVLRGEMSLVGPRPLVTEEDEQVHGLDRSRLHLTPGMTGPWQVLGARVPMREMVGIDYLYVANWTLWQDLKLLLRTVRHVARSANV